MSAPHLSVAVLGMGSVGSTYAYHLSRADHAVTAIARPNSVRFTQLSRDSAVILTTGERAAVTPVDHLDEAIAYDLVLVCVLDMQVDGLLPALRRCAAKAVQMTFNTYRPEQVIEAVGGSTRCSLGMPFVQASLNADGQLRCTTSRGRTLLGDQRWVDLFNGAGVPAAYEAQMALWLRNHASLCIAFEAIAVTAKRSGNGGASWADATRIARGLQEGLALTQRLGYPLHGQGKGFFYRSPAAVPAFVLWSLSRVKDFRELLATGEAECCALCDAMVGQAAAAQPPFPVPALQAVRPTPKS